MPEDFLFGCPQKREDFPVSDGAKAEDSVHLARMLGGSSEMGMI